MHADNVNARNGEEGRRATHRRTDRALRALAVVYLVAIAALVGVYKASVISVFARNPFFAVYGVLVSSYILSRFLLSLFYRDTHLQGLEPHAAVVVPAFNEEEAVYASIEALLGLDYPADRLDVVVVNDGSTDGTAKEIDRAQAGSDGRVRAIHFEHNQGKRAAMARGMRETTAECSASGMRLCSCRMPSRRARTTMPSSVGSRCTSDAPWPWQRCRI